MVVTAPRGWMTFARDNPALVHRTTTEPVAADISRRTLDRMLRRAATGNLITGWW